MSFAHPSIPLTSIPIAVREAQFEQWPAYLPGNGAMFLMMGLLHLLLLSVAFSSVNSQPGLARICWAIWGLMVLGLAFLAWRGLQYFDDPNPVWFNWAFKWHTFATLTLVAMLIARLMAWQRERWKGQVAAESDVPMADPWLMRYPNLRSEQLVFVRQAEAAVQEHIAEPKLDCKYLADVLCLSEQTLRRRLQDALEMTPGAFIREQRLVRASEIDASGAVRSQKELAAAVGFRSPAYFMRLYRKFQADR